MPDDIEIKQPPKLFAETQEIIRLLEDRLQAPILCYWNSHRGGICGNDVLALYQIMEYVQQADTVYLFIKSDGGSGKEALRMVNLIRGHCNKLISLVPLECASAATMMAIGADEIQMGPMAFLSSVDTSLTHDLSPLDRDNDRVSVSLDELNRVVKLWRHNTEDSGSNPYKSLFEYVHPLVIGAVDRAESLSIMLCEELLSYHIGDKERVRQIAEVLNAGYPSHSYPILVNEAQRIGLNARPLDKPINDLLLELNALYSEMGQRAITDFDDTRSHSNEILNILEARDIQVFYQNDKDWFYRTEERRWLTLNDNSNWHVTERINGEEQHSILHFA
ncbi:ClpP class serine protease [Neisseria sp. HSC-16F19]|nr:hypothetical protein [Neisseria sp. HSC-16F19]MCP2040991.1 ClpP class serine protease [Neisseria sp. HSC-16F19]